MDDSPQSYDGLLQQAPVPPYAAGARNDEIPWARPVSWPAAVHSAPADPLLLGQLPRSAAWFDILIVIVGLVAWDLLVGFALTQFSGSGSQEGNGIENSPNRGPVIPLIALRAAGALTLVSLILRWRSQDAASIGLRCQGCIMHVVFGVVSLGAAAGLICLAMGVLFLGFPEALIRMNENGSLIMRFLPPLPVVGFAALMAIVACYEEVVFRGFLMPRLRRAIGAWAPALLLSSLLFVIPHAADQTWAALIPISILSLVFSISTLWRRSIIPGIIAHWLFNFSVVVYLKYAAGDQWK